MTYCEYSQAGYQKNRLQSLWLIATYTSSPPSDDDDDVWWSLYNFYK